MRWTIISDESGHDYLCPAHLAAEARNTLDAIEAYWSTLQKGSGEPPADPKYLIRLEGGELTFAEPLVNGAAP